MANIKDVAKLAGVSVTTVSRVLNNKGYISQDTYESVYKQLISLIMSQIRLLETFLDKNLIILV